MMKIVIVKSINLSLKVSKLIFDSFPLSIKQHEVGSLNMINFHWVFESEFNLGLFFDSLFSIKRDLN